MPIFTDEAIYLRWSQIIAGDWKYLYLPLTDGKPPLYMWLTAVVMKFFPQADPLILGRLVSLFAGLLDLAGVYFLSRQLFSDRKISWLAAVFYALCPFVFLYSWLATADILLSTLATWSLGLGIKLTRNLQIKTAVLLGAVSGLGWLTKSPGLETILLLPTLAIFVDPKRWLKFGFLLGLAILIARWIYSVIFFFPQAYIISLKNADFALSLTEFLQNPLRYARGNFPSLINWELAYLTWPVAALVTVGFLYKPSRQKVILAGFFAAHFLFMTFFNKVIYPRFLLMYTPLLLILAAAGTREIWQALKSLKLFRVLILVIVLFFPLYADFKILTDPVNAPIAGNDSLQYLNSWSAGWGVREVNNFFTQQCKIYSKISLGTEGTFGLTPYALELYQKDHPCLEIKAFWPPPDRLPGGLDYYIIYQRSTPRDFPMREIMKFRQGNSDDYFKLYKVL